MNYTLTDGHRQIQDLIRRVARSKVAPRANEIDRTAEYPSDMFALLKELGLFTLPFPAEYGSAASMLSACIAVEEFGRVCYDTAYLLVVQWIPFGAILAGGTKDQRDRYLPGLASGELRAAFSTTEPQSGSDVQGIKTKATPVPGGYRLDGAKIWCTNSHVADFILVAARTGDAGGKSEISLFIVEKGAPGLQVGRKEDAKCFATDVAMRVATDAVQLFGAAGVSAEFPLNRYFRGAKVLQIIEGTNQIQRNIIAGSVLGKLQGR
jgi:acyl-CoA dehydrogenase